MERKDLIGMASEAGFGKLLSSDGLPTMWHGADLGMLECFAELIASAEREACAKIADARAMRCEAKTAAAEDEDEVTELRRLAWQFLVLAAEMRKRSNVI